LARRLELPSLWLDRAEALLGEEHRDLRKLLAEVESVRQQLAQTQARLESDSRDLEKQRHRMTDELQATKDERQRVGRQLRTEMEDFRQQVTKRLRTEMERLRGEMNQGRKKGLVAASVGRLFEAAPEIELEETTDAPPEVGGLVRHRSLGWDGRLERVKDGTAEVVVMGKKIRCGLEDLASVRENAGEESRRSPKVVLRTSSAEDVEVPVELNLVGFRVEPALEELDRYLDRALLSSHRQVRVIHGFGSGRLRQAIRQHLRPHPAADGFRSGGKQEGGDGATVVTLSNS
jgi:DNA mismatch repair protein MutS2